MKSKIFRITMLSLIMGALLLSSCDKDDDDVTTSETDKDTYKYVEVKKWTKDYDNDVDYISMAYIRNSNGFISSIDGVDHYTIDGLEKDATSSLEVEHNSSGLKLKGRNDSSWDAEFNSNGTVSEFVVTIIKINDEEKITHTYKYECSYNDALQLANIKYIYNTDDKKAEMSSRTQDFKFSYDQEGALISMASDNYNIEYKYDKDISNKNGQFWYEFYGAYSDDIIDDWTDEPTFMLLGMFGKASAKFPTSMTETYIDRDGEEEVNTYHYEFTLNEAGNILTEKVDYRSPITVTFEY